MHPTVRVLVKPLPISSIPISALRLPPKPKQLPNLRESSPTIEKLLSKLANAEPSSGSADLPVESGQAGELPQDGRGLSGFKLSRKAGGNGVPSNLRVEEWVPKRREFEGVGKKHRDLLRRLRREA